MKREIKFRVWDNKLSQWVNIFTHKIGVQLTDMGLAMSTGWDSEDNPTWDFNEIEFDRYEFPQFTGLKDRNGREIYEGDILMGLNRIPKIIKWSDEGACFVEEEQFKPVCTWSFDMLFRKHKKAFASNGQLTSHYIIGNIYENPELLNP